MTTLASGSSVTVAVRDGGTVTIATNGGFGTAVVTLTEGGVSTVNIGPEPVRRVLGPYKEGASIVLTNSSSGAFDYDVETQMDPSSVAITGGTIKNIKLRVKDSRLQLPNRLNFRQLMASPPTPTLTTSHTIASPQLWPSVTDPNGDANYAIAGTFFTYTRAGAPLISGTSFPDYQFIKFTSTNYGTIGPGLTNNGAQVSFIHDGTAIEIFIKGSGGSLLMKVDDQLLTAAPQVVANDGTSYYYYVNFTTAKPRRIDLQLTQCRFGGVYTGALDTVYAAPIRGPRCIVMGDSFTEGTGASSALLNHAWMMGDALGWDDVWNSGVGGTGYLAGLSSAANFRSRISTDVTPFNPDVVMICGGINDTAQNSVALQTEASALFAALQAALPNATLIVCSPFWRNGAGSINSFLTATRDAIKAAALAAGALYFDLLEMPLPLNYVPQTATLGSSTGSGTTFTVNRPLPIRGTFKFSNGDKFQVKNITGAGPYTVTPDTGPQNVHTAGETITQVGDCFWTGPGKGATVTGTSGLVGGSGGTNGTFALGITPVAGNNPNAAAGTFTVAGGAVTSISITTAGDGYTAAPTLSFAASAGLTGASATATISAGPAGYGNSDGYVVNDGTHPSTQGHLALGQVEAWRVMDALAPN